MFVIETVERGCAREVEIRNRRVAPFEICAKIRRVIEGFGGGELRVVVGSARACARGR